MKKSISIIRASLMLCSTIAFSACSNKADNKPDTDAEETEAILELSKGQFWNCR